jgi:hypothetical protein
MMRDQSLLNAVQTAGILFLSIILAYVVWRLEKALLITVATLRNLGKAHDDLIRSQDALEDSVADVWRRIEQIEARQVATKGH